MTNVLHRRKQICLRDYDYSEPGEYFITVCTHDRRCIFGIVQDGEMKTNSFGKIVHSCWFDLVNHYGNIELDEFVVMPNHVHGIIGIFESVAVGAGLRPAPTGKKNDPLSEIIRAFKSFSARQIIEIRKTAGKPIWQRNYFDHIIRDERSLEGIRDYISTNPQRWEDDKENPDKSGNDPFESWLLAQGRIRIKS